MSTITESHLRRSRPLTNRLCHTSTQAFKVGLIYGRRRSFLLSMEIARGLAIRCKSSWRRRHREDASESRRKLPLIHVWYPETVSTANYSGDQSPKSTTMLYLDELPNGLTPFYTVSAFASLGATSATYSVWAWHGLRKPRVVQGKAQSGTISPLNGSLIAPFAPSPLKSRPYLIPVKLGGSLVEGRIQLPRLPYPSSDAGVWYSRERLKPAVFGSAVRQRVTYQAW